MREIDEKKGSDAARQFSLEMDKANDPLAVGWGKDTISGQELYYLIQGDHAIYLPLQDWLTIARRIVKDHS